MPIYRVTSKYCVKEEAHKATKSKMSNLLLLQGRPLDSSGYIIFKTEFITQGEVNHGATIRVEKGYINMKPWYAEYLDLTVPLMKFLMQATALCYHAQDFYKGNIMLIGEWFVGKVNHKMEWDIKRKDPWEKSIPGIRFPGNKLVYFYNGLYTPESLGNLFFGFLGSAVGFSPQTLFMGGGYANHNKFSLSILFGPTYGDAPNDHVMIQKGIDLFKQFFPNRKSVF